MTTIEATQRGSLPAGWIHPGAIDEAWLALHDEEVIEPALPLIDPHHHLWRHPGHCYLVPELVADLHAGHNVRGTVYVEASSFYDAQALPEFRAVAETRTVARLASDASQTQAADICQGIVGFAALRLGDAVAPVLEAQVAAGQGRLKGIRNVSIWDETSSLRSLRSAPPPALLLDTSFRAGFAHLAKFGLSFDAYVYHTQLDEVLDLARTFPDTKIVLNHLGGPLGSAQYAGRSEEVFAAWDAAMARLAEVPNVLVKLGGLAMPSVGLGLRDRPKPASSQELAVLWKPYVEGAIGHFGPTRCMFESNFPVDNEVASYRTLWNAFKRLAAGMSPADKQWLFHDCALTTYQLQLSAASAIAPSKFDTASSSRSDVVR